MNEFRQFGTTNGKTLLPIYVVGILLAILLYIFFNHVSMPIKKKELLLQNDNCSHCVQQQIQQLQNQIQYLINQQSINKKIDFNY